VQSKGDSSSGSPSCQQQHSEELPPPHSASKPDVYALTSSSIELANILRLGWPTCISLFLCQLPGLVLLGFLGDDTDQLAAAGVGFMFSNITGYSLIIGFGGGAQPLISQAFGAGNYTRCGDLLQRQLAIHLVMCIAIAIVWWKTEAILLCLGQPATVASLTGEFMRWRLPGLPFLALREDMNSFLIAQRIMKMPMLLSVSVNLLNIGLFPMLIGYMGFGGAPFAMTLATMLQAILMVMAARCVLPNRHSWPSWSIQTAFSGHGWLELLQIATPSAVLILCEWWGWEVNLFFAGMLCGKSAQECVELDVFPIASNTMVIGFMCHWGFSVAASTVVGNALGAGDFVQARNVTNITLCLVGALGGLIGVVLVLVKNDWATLFTDDLAVSDMTSEVMPFVAAYIFLDALGPGALTSILRGMGVVKVPAIITFVSFYLIGLPVGLWRTFGQPHLGIRGLWGGLVLAMLIMVSALLTYLYVFVDWRRTAQLALERCITAPNGMDSAEDKASSKALQLPAKSVLGRSAKYAHVAEEEEDGVAP